LWIGVWVQVQKPPELVVLTEEKTFLLDCHKTSFRHSQFRRGTSRFAWALYVLQFGKFRFRAHNSWPRVLRKPPTWHFKTQLLTALWDQPQLLRKPVTQSKRKALQFLHQVSTTKWFEHYTTRHFWPRFNRTIRHLDTI